MFIMNPHFETNYPMKKKMYLLCFMLTILVACNQQKKPTDNPSTPEASTLPTPADNKEAPIRSEALDASELIQERPLSAHATQFYTNLLWHYEAAVVINNPEGGKEYLGKWVKFNPDNTLETAFYDGAISQGRWIIDEAKNVLTILEGGERPTLTQWKVQSSSSSDAIMIFVGTKKYANNATQIKMMRYNGIPVKEVQ